MSEREHLHEAADLVSEAAESTEGDASERLKRIGDQIESAAQREHGPDHGRLARHLTALDQVRADVDDDTAATIEEARDHLTEFRKTVEGV